MSNVVFMYKPHGNAQWFYTETETLPTLYSLPSGRSAGPFRGFLESTAIYGHTVKSKLNFVRLQLNFNRTDITGLVFEIPSVDKNGNKLFANQAELKATFMGQ